MIRYLDETKDVRTVDKDVLLEDINKVYRAGLQEVQDKKDELWEMEEDRRDNGGNMKYNEYVALVNKINMLTEDIEKMQLINDGMENAREIVLSAEVVEK